MSRPRRAVAAAALGQLIVIVALALAARTLLRDLDTVRSTMGRLDPLPLLGSFALAVVVVGLLAERWAAALAILGARRPLRAVVAWFAVGQVGKYVPGGIWQVIGQGERARRAGVPPRAAYASVALSTAGLVGGAAIVTLVGQCTEVISGAAWWVVALGVTAAGVGALPPVRRRALRALRLDDSGTTLRPGAVLRLVAGTVPAWAAIGIATWLAAESVGASARMATLVVAGVASWLVGILTVPAPGGIGAREAAFVALLSGTLGTPLATVVAIVARLVFVAADAACFAAGRVRLSAEARRAPSSTATG